jgi:hypothetical protein
LIFEAAQITIVNSARARAGFKSTGASEVKYHRLFSLTIVTVCILVALPTARAGLSHTDPQGDTFGALGAPDIVAVTTEFTSPAMDEMKFTVDFDNSIDVLDFIGYLDIDNDRDPATGGFGGWGTDLQPGSPNSWLNNFIGQSLVPGLPVQLGGEYYIDLGSAMFSVDVAADVYEASSASLVGTTSALSFGANSLEFTLPLSLLGGNKHFNYGLIAGTSGGPSDRVSNGTAPLTTVPEPSSAVLITLLFGIAIPLYRPRRVMLHV